MQIQSNQSWTDGLSRAEGEECLANLRRLADHLKSAIKAIVERKLAALQDSLHLQQISCGQLADLRCRSAARLRCSSSLEADCINSNLALEIKATKESVLLLSSSYAALLKHSGDTLQLLAGLYRSYSGFARPTSGMQANLATWSCEV